MIPGIDLAIVIIGILTNLILAVMFGLRAAGRPRLAFKVGGFSLALALPLAAAVIFNASNGRPWWTFVLPLPLLLYDALEFWLDYIRHSNFRQTAWLGPYLASFYLALMMMIGFAFLADRRYGYITLAAYFLNLAATLAAYRRVGHG
jgi:hypothetical protein